MKKQNKTKKKTKNKNKNKEKQFYWANKQLNFTGLESYTEMGIASVL